MRVALLSDIHGNLVALEAVLADIAREGTWDAIVVAGDLVWGGPWPGEVIDRVREMGCTVIQGNTDAFLAADPAQATVDSEIDTYAQRRWMEDKLGPSRIGYLAGLPFSHRISPAPGHDLLIVHANPKDQVTPMLPRLPAEEVAALLMQEGQEPDWEALAFGHVHVPFVRRWNSRLLVDVASAGSPCDGDQRAAWAILTFDGSAWQAEHRRVFYEVPVAAHYMHVSGMPKGERAAERLVRAGMQTW